MRLSRRLAITALSLVSAASLVACGGASAGADITGEVTVFAAASLQDAFETLAASFQDAHPGVRIAFDFQGSQDLVASLDGGSPADILATANNSTMTDAANKGLVGEQTEFATNVLTLIVPAGNPAGVTGINDGSLDKADLVVCAPEVPCGEATQKLAAELGVTLNPVSEEQKVTDVRGKVESGEAQAGIVYTTDAAQAGDPMVSSNSLWLRGIGVLGFNLGAFTAANPRTTGVYLRRALSLAASGEVTVRIAERAPIREAPRILADMAAGATVGKAVLVHERD